jgi:superfamily II DNA/RNA helicase
VHRVGRTARAGQTGEAITFMSPGEIGEVRAIEYHIGRQLPRIELEGYGFGLATDEKALPTPTKKAVRATRGFRMGSQARKELSPEELKALLQVG